MPRAIKWRPVRNQPCGTCGLTANGLAYKATGVVLCYACSSDAVRLVADAMERVERRGKRRLN